MNTLSILTQTAAAGLCWLGLTAAGPCWAQEPLLSAQRADEKLRRMVSQAALVVEGKAVAYHSYRSNDGSQVLTAATLRVYKVFKGQVRGPEVVAVTEGGSVNGQGGGWTEDGVPIGNNVTGVFFLGPTTAAVHGFAVAPPAYRVLGGRSGIIVYPGIPPELNRASWPDYQFRRLESTLYPALVAAAERHYYIVRPFDINTYNVVWERRGIDTQAPRAPAAASQKRQARPGKAP